MPPLADGRQHVGHGHPHPIGEVFDAPGLLHLLAVVGVGDRLIPGEDVGQAAHIAGALDVVLAAQGVDAAAVDADIAAEHGQVGQGLDVVGAHGVLGNAHAVDDGAGLGPGDTSGPPPPLTSAGTPLIFSTYSGVYLATVSFRASKFSVRSAT